MSKKQETNESIQIEVNKTEGLEELFANLKKDEEVLKQNIIIAQGQLQYNQLLQRAIQQLIEKLKSGCSVSI